MFFRLKNFPFMKDKFFIGAGINLLEGQIERIYTDISPGEHFWIIGATGSGKTVFLSLLEVQAILNDIAVVKADLKFSPENFYTLYVLSYLMKKKFYIISEVGNTYNPFVTCKDTLVKTQMLIDMLSDVTGRKEAYYEEVKKSLVSAFVEAFDSTGLKWSLIDLYACLLDTRVLTKLIGLAKCDSIYILRDLVERLESENNYIKSQAMKEISFMKYALSHIVRFNFLNSYSPEVDLRKVIANRNVVYFVFPALRLRETSKYLARLFLSDLMSVISELNTEMSYKKHSTKFFISIDEFQMFLLKGVELLFSQSRSAGAIVSVAHQSVYDIDYEAVKELRNVIATNAKNKVFFKLPDKESVDTALGLAGKELQLRFNIENVSLSTTEHTLLEVRDLTTLPVFHFFAILDDRFYRGHTYIVNDLSSLVGKQIPRPDTSSVNVDRKNGIRLWEFYQELSKK